VQFVCQQKTYALRLCAVRKSRLAAERARRKALRKAQKNGTQAQTEALELTAYVLVLTSVDSKLFPAKAVLDLYRGRWQIELVFKRLKSLLEAGHVPKSDDDSAKAWMQAKILSALLVDRVLLEGKFFSPWGFAL
jgi:transposase